MKAMIVVGRSDVLVFRVRGGAEEQPFKTLKPFNGSVGSPCPARLPFVLRLIEGSDSFKSFRGS